MKNVTIYILRGKNGIHGTTTNLEQALRFVQDKPNASFHETTLGVQYAFPVQTRGFLPSDEGEFLFLQVDKMKKERKQ